MGLHGAGSKHHREVKRQQTLIIKVGEEKNAVHN